MGMLPDWYSKGTTGVADGGFGTTGVFNQPPQANMGNFLGSNNKTDALIKALRGWKTPQTQQNMQPNLSVQNWTNPYGGN